MAYKINRRDEYVEIPDTVMSARKTYNFMKKMQKTPEFYELEPAEVMQVLFEDDDLPDGPEGKDYSYFGAITARPVVSGRDLPGDNNLLDPIRPLEPNIKDYPIPGEYVIVVKYFGDPEDYFSGMYYTQKLNLFNSVNSNSFPGLAKIWSPFVEDFSDFTVGKFKKEDSIRQVKAKLGDVVLHGRQGQSINFSSGDWEKTTPNIKIKAGQLTDRDKFLVDVSYLDEFQKPVEEDINADGSSIWMTTDEEVDLNTGLSNATDHRNMSKVHEDKGAQDGGKQVIINSDRIIFNSKQNEIFGYAANGIGWSTKWSFTVDADRRVNLNSPDVQIGRGSHEVSPDEGAWPGVITITPHEEIPGATEEKRPGFGKGGVSLGYSSKSGLLVKDKYEKKYDKDKWEYGSIIGDPALEPVVKGEQLVDTLNDIIKLLKRLTYSGGGPLSNLPGKKLKVLEEIYIGLDQVQLNLGVNFLSDFVKTI
jgi:hypothetical protein|tara:strand:+ start:549 stop:1976 length:1428 start_codon:yes stop_codon:yes gene_type:complete